jgi:hypothetical protein
MGRQRKLTANNKPVNCGKLVSFQQQNNTNSDQQQQMHFNNQQAFDYRLPNKITSFYGQEALCDTQLQQQQQLQQQPLPQEQQQQQQEFANLTFGYFDSVNGTGSQQQEQQHIHQEQQQQLHLDLSFGSCGDNSSNSSNNNSFSGGCSDYLLGHNSCGFATTVSTSAVTGYCYTASLHSKTALLGPNNNKGRFNCDQCHVHFAEESQLLSHNRWNATKSKLFSVLGIRIRIH